MMGGENSACSARHCSAFILLGKLRADSRGMTRDPDKIKNYDQALLDKLPETSTDALGNDVLDCRNEEEA